MSTQAKCLRAHGSLVGDSRIWRIVAYNRLTGVYTLKRGPETRNVYAEQMTLVKEAE